MPEGYFDPLSGGGGLIRDTDRIWLSQETSGMYRLVDIKYYTASGTFDKADYPGLKAVRVRVQAAGGGSGGVAGVTSSEDGESGGGAGGEYAEAFILEASLGTSESVTVGTGGSGGSAGNNDGGGGGASSFGAHVTTDGGSGGSGMDATSGSRVAAGGVGGSGSTGADLAIPGGDGGFGVVRGGLAQYHSLGGASQLGRATPFRQFSFTPSAVAGSLYGGGAVGAVTANFSNFPGADGGGGIVIVEVYA